MIIRFLFKRRKTKAPGEALPPSLESAIKGMNVVHRIRIDGEPRVMLAFAGETVSSWYHTSEETRRRIAAAWPELTEPQLDRACRAVAGAIRAARDISAQGRKRGAWAAWKPLRFPDTQE
jgi:hypothetical protein